jgi:hypothetical protein
MTGGLPRVLKLPRNDSVCLLIAEWIRINGSLGELYAAKPDRREERQEYL